jgi:hypothetical protein
MIKDIQFKPKARNSNSPDQNSHKKPSKFVNIFNRRGSIDETSNSESLQNLQQPRAKETIIRKIQSLHSGFHGSP